MATTPFVHLHNHSHFSILDASSHIEPMIKLAKELEMPAVGLTDHGNMSGAVQLWRACKKEGLKSLIGCELYVSVGDHLQKSIKPGQRNYHHLVVIAQNTIGYQNLCAIISESFLRGFYYKPRVSMAFLGNHSEGLLASSACMAGAIPQALLTSTDLGLAKVLVQDFGNIFQDRFYLELQDHGIPEQKRINEGLINLAQETGLPLIWTNDCHFLKEDDFEPHKRLKCVQGGRRVDAPDFMANHVYRPEHRFRSGDEMLKLAQRYAREFSKSKKEILKAVSRTVDLAESCEFNFATGKYFFPSVKVEEPEGEYKELIPEEVHQEFYRLCFEGFARRSGKFLLNRGTEYIWRLFYEMQMISKMGFESYFLIVSDLIRWAKSHRIPVGPGRGSAAGSLVSYCLDITELDPIAHNLLFERFLNPARVSMPDIDIDFSKLRRTEVIDYTIQKYGRDNVAQIITFGTMGARAVLKDVSRVHGLDLMEAEKLASLVPLKPGDPYDLERTFNEIEETKKVLEGNSKFQEVWDIARKLEDTKRNASIHAAGVVITPEPVSHFVPLFKQGKGDSQVIAAAYDMRDLEELGLVKMDYLGLKTLDLIKECLRLAEAEDLELDDIPLDDPKVLDLFSCGATKGVFQFESPGMRQMLKELKPSKFDDIVAMNALYRPGPIDSGMVRAFINRKNGLEKATAMHPDLEEVLASTYGVMVYQEQVMQTVRRLAGFSLGEADLMRKAMGKKNKELMAKELEKFTKAGKDRGYSEADMKMVGEAIEKFARYGFNRAHAAAYSVVAWQTAWLKVYYPIEFMCALLTNEAQDGKLDKVTEYVGDTKKMGIQIFPPDINYSDVFFSLEKDSQNSPIGIRFGLAGIKNVGEEVVREIIEEREKRGEFRSLSDFLRRITLNKKVIESLIFAGATASLGGHPAEHFSNYERIATAQKKAGGSYQTSILSMVGAYDEVLRQDLKTTEPWDETTLANYEREVLGMSLIHHSLNDHKDEIKDDLASLKEAVRERQKVHGEVLCVITALTHKVSAQKNKKYMVLGVEDLSGTAETMYFGPYLELKVGQIVWMKANVKTTGDESILLYATELRPFIDETLAVTVAADEPEF